MADSSSSEKSYSMHAFRDGLLRSYRSGREDIGRSFFSPCLHLCTRYDRAAGYFSSTALVDWATAMTRMIEDQVKIRLLISPKLTPDDAEILRKIASEEDRRRYLNINSSRIVAEAMEFSNAPADIGLRLKLFAWMVASGQIELRFAILRSQSESAMFHDKMGAFYFPDGDTVAFMGSANETISGYRANIERLHVYANWRTGDVERVKDLCEDFQALWNGEERALIVEPLTPESVSLLRTVAPDKRPTLTNEVKEPDSDFYANWSHQNEAVSEFLRCRSGVLEMATGTGKTRTALRIWDGLLSSGQVDSLVICVDGPDLLDQWREQVLQLITSKYPGYKAYRQYANHHELSGFVLNPQNSVLLISRSQVDKLFLRLSGRAADTILIIHDEVHGLGEPQLVSKLKGAHAIFRYRLGLSATPEREYDDIGSKFIEDEIGPVIYKFGLDEAIRRGVLCEFDYIPLEYQITEKDRERLRLVYARQAARRMEGRPMSNEELWTELARVYKTAEQKPQVFSEYLEKNPQVIKDGIIFVEEKTYGDLVIGVIDSHTMLYRTYYGEDDSSHLKDFANGRIDCLITCHRISQGIDINRLRNVILFSSSRAKLETIQRIGRCLRIDPNSPNKRARVIDFIRAKDKDEKAGVENADLLRQSWLSALSSVKRSI